MPGSSSLAESYTPSLICNTFTLPSPPAPTSGVKEIHPAGTGCPLNVTFPDSWAGFGLDEQPTAIAKTAAATSSLRKAITRLLGRSMGSGLPVTAQYLTAVRRTHAFESEGADVGADGPDAAVAQAGDHGAA